MSGKRTARADAQDRALRRRYGLPLYRVADDEIADYHEKSYGRGRWIGATWIAPPDALLQARLVSDDDLALFYERAAQADGLGSVEWHDDACTKWRLSSNGGRRGDEHGLCLSASYLPDVDVDPPAVRTVKLTRAVEKMVRKATGRRVRFADLRSADATNAPR